MVMNAWSYTSNPFIAYTQFSTVSFIPFVYTTILPLSCTMNPPASILYHHVNVQNACYQLFMYWCCLCSDVGTGA